MTTNDISTTTNLNQISETQMRWVVFFSFIIWASPKLVHLCSLHSNYEIRWPLAAFWNGNTLCRPRTERLNASPPRLGFWKCGPCPINHTIIQIVARFSLRCLDDTCPSVWGPLSWHIWDPTDPIDPEPLAYAPNYKYILMQLNAIESGRSVR